MNWLFKKESETIELTGHIHQLIYHDEETGYSVIRFVDHETHEKVTIVGNVPIAVAGQGLRIKGVMEYHPKFGEQIRIKECQPVMHGEMDGIKSFLKSGYIKGIGDVLADRIIERFGKDTLRIMEDSIDRLGEVQGVGPIKLKSIKKAWNEQKELRDIMIFLQSHGISFTYAMKIYKRYGSETTKVVKDDPYRLATEIHGIGFQKADEIASRFGFQKDDERRIKAGIIYVLSQTAEDGHVCFPYSELMERCSSMLGVQRDELVKGFGNLLSEGRLMMEDLNTDLDSFEPDRKAVYLPSLYVSERGVALHIKRLLKAKKSILHIRANEAIVRVSKLMGVELTEKQKEAIRRAITDKVVVITGGPGTGKTTIIKAILNIYRENNGRVVLCAPTGRASKRMSESAQYPATTIHRTLGYNHKKGGFMRNEKSPLNVDLVVVDEVSMVDTVLMYHLLKAIPDDTSLIMVGDANQLPSVGPGNVLREIIDSGKVSTIELKEIHRQSEGSKIVVNAHRVNMGMMPELTAPGADVGDFYFIEQDEQNKVLEIIKELITKRIPIRFHMNPMEDIQVICPMHKGLIGTENLNRILQDTLNKEDVMLNRGGRSFKLHDRVMQVRNNYEKEVFNGDIGRIQSIQQDSGGLVVDFDGRLIMYDRSELDEIVLAYAISVHKSQGSEYPCVIVPILMQHYILLQRNLLYTAITRAKELVIIIGNRKALAYCIKNTRTIKRYTLLSRMIKE